jgi:NADH dehydrogenase/NADH:ubiquinone oxidoreductase subunit G
VSYKPNPDKNINLTIDGIPITVPEGTRIQEKKKKANVKIPTLCDHPELCKRAWCRICVVECDGKGKLITACANYVWEGVSIRTNNLRLIDMRKTILELILANHPQDCLLCVKNKKCELQQLAETFGIRYEHFERCLDDDDAKNKDVIESKGKTIVRNMGKCIKCGRCVEACNAHSKFAIGTKGRSHEFTISTPYGQPLSPTMCDTTCDFCGKCAEVCPVASFYELK